MFTLIRDTRPMRRTQSYSWTISADWVSDIVTRFYLTSLDLIYIDYFIKVRFLNICAFSIFILLFRLGLFFYFPCLIVLHKLGWLYRTHISSKFKHNFDLFWWIKVLVIIKTFHKSLYFNFVQKVTKLTKLYSMYTLLTKFHTFHKLSIEPSIAQFTWLNMIFCVKLLIWLIGYYAFLVLDFMVFELAFYESITVWISCFNTVLV